MKIDNDNDIYIYSLDKKPQRFLYLKNFKQKKNIYDYNYVFNILWVCVGVEMKITCSTVECGDGGYGPGNCLVDCKERGYMEIV